MSFTVINGDVIRAFDFKPMVGRDDCYVEGEVVSAKRSVGRPRLNPIVAVNVNREPSTTGF